MNGQCRLTGKEHVLEKETGEVGGGRLCFQGSALCVRVRYWSFIPQSEVAGAVMMRSAVYETDGNRGDLGPEDQGRGSCNHLIKPIFIY